MLTQVDAKRTISKKGPFLWRQNCVDTFLHNDKKASTITAITFFSVHLKWQVQHNIKASLFRLQNKAFVSFFSSISSPVLSIFVIMPKTEFPTGITNPPKAEMYLKRSGKNGPPKSVYISVDPLKGEKKKRANTMSTFLAFKRRFFSSLFLQHTLKVYKSLVSSSSCLLLLFYCQCLSHKISQWKIISFQFVVDSKLFFLFEEVRDWNTRLEIVSARSHLLLLLLHPSWQIFGDVSFEAINWKFSIGARIFWEFSSWQRWPLYISLLLGRLIN